MKITILSVGKKPTHAEKELIDKYLVRIQKPWQISWKFINEYRGQPNQVIKQQTERLLQEIGDKLTILLDQRGEDLTNQKLVDYLENRNPQELYIIIGGAYGVDQALRQRAEKVYRISGLVLPHKIVRIILAEQLYRTQTILNNHPYHHN